MATRFLKTDAGDLDLASGNLQLIDSTSQALLPAKGVSEMAQAIKQKAEDVLKQFQGEWFLNKNDGVPWMTVILGQKNPDFGVIRSIFKTKLLAIENVVAVDDVTFDFDGVSRTLDYEVILMAANGSQVTISS